MHEPPETGYYGVPVIHGSHWKWLIIWYFFFGGISGGSAVIAAFARLCGGPSGALLARTATYVSFAALIPCPPLLILDLGRPGRFLNMLRAFRRSSPMSVGTWGLTAFGLIATASTMEQVGLDLADRAGRSKKEPYRMAGTLLAVVGAPLGFFVAGYTGVLLAATAVPLWSKQPALLGPLFLSSAMSSGAAAVAATATVIGPGQGRAHDGLQTLEAFSTIAEGVLLTAWIVRLGATGKPIAEGRLGAVVRHGVIGGGMALPLALTAGGRNLPHGQRRLVTRAASILTLAGVLALRYAVIEGGRQSADDPQATFDMTR